MNGEATAIACLLLTAPTALAQRNGDGAPHGSTEHEPDVEDGDDPETILLMATFGAAALVLLMLIGLHRIVKMQQRGYTLGDVKVARSALEPASSDGDALSVGLAMPYPSRFIVLHDLDAGSEDGLQTSSETDDVRVGDTLGDVLGCVQDKAGDGKGKAGMVWRASMMTIPVVTAAVESDVDDDAGCLNTAPTEEARAGPVPGDDGHVVTEVSEREPKAEAAFPWRTRETTAAGAPLPSSSPSSNNDSDEYPDLEF